MSRDPLRIDDYLDHIAEAIDRITQYTEGMDSEAFMANRLVQDAVIRNVEVIGEASNNIRKHHSEFDGIYSSLPLQEAYGMRNAVAHGYFQVDMQIVWYLICDHLPDFRVKVSEVKASLERSRILISRNPEP